MIYDTLLQDRAWTYDGAVWLAAQGLREVLAFPVFLKSASAGNMSSDHHAVWLLHNLMLRYLQNVKVAGYSLTDDNLAVRIIQNVIADESDRKFAKWASATPAVRADFWEQLPDDKKFFLVTGLPQLVYERVKRGSFNNFVAAVLASAMNCPHIAKVAGVRFGAKLALKPLALAVCRLQVGKS